MQRLVLCESINTTNVATMRGHGSLGLPNFLPKAGSALASFVLSQRLGLGLQWRVRHTSPIHSIYHSTAVTRSDRVAFYGARRGKSVWSFKEAIFVPSLIEAGAVTAAGTAPARVRHKPQRHRVIESGHALLR